MLGKANSPRDKISEFFIQQAISSNAPIKVEDLIKQVKQTSEREGPLQNSVEKAFMQFYRSRHSSQVTSDHVMSDRKEPENLDLEEADYVEGHCDEIASYRLYTHEGQDGQDDRESCEGYGGHDESSKTPEAIAVRDSSEHYFSNDTSNDLPVISAETHTTCALQKELNEAYRQMDQPEEIADEMETLRQKLGRSRMQVINDIKRRRGVDRVAGIRLQ